MLQMEFQLLDRANLSLTKLGTTTAVGSSSRFDLDHRSVQKSLPSTVDHICGPRTIPVDCAFDSVDRAIGPPCTEGNFQYFLGYFGLISL